MEYTRSKGDDYETFEGTPEEIAKLIKKIDQPTTVCETEVVHKRVYEDAAEVIRGVKGMGHKVSDYETCSCGVDGCELYKESSGRG